jgi:hypothetical protein
MKAADVAKVVAMLEARPDVRRATLYVSPKYTVKATRQCRPKARDQAETILVTAGRPNYQEREVIAILRKCKEPFPVKKVQLQSWPNRTR